MKRIKSYNNFLNESLITEIVDPITLAFAVGALGIAFGPEIKKAYRSRKISKADIKDLKKMLIKAEAKVKKYERQGLEHDAAEVQSEVDYIKSRIQDLNREVENHENIIKDFEKDKKIQKDLEQQLKNLDHNIVRKAIRDAKKDTSTLK